jgi:chromate reductase, NAD(P)H dehydrogenase (quinone)
MTRLLAVSGSLRKNATNTGLLRALRDIAPDHVTFEMASLHGIAAFNEDDEANTGKPAAVVTLDQQFRAADGIVFSTPEYNSSIPGHLKNVMDWLSRGGNPLLWKRVGVIGAAAGLSGSARAQQQLRMNLAGMQAIVMPKPDVMVNNNEQKFDAEGNLTDETARKHLGAWLKAFLHWVEHKP